MDQTYGKTAPGYVLQPIDNSGNGRTQPWQTPPGWVITKSAEDSAWNGKVVVYKNQFTGEVMAVPMGTNGNSDAKGWLSNSQDYGLSQWRSPATNDEGLTLKLEVYRALDKALGSGGNLLITGDSKGGTQVQFMLADLIKDRDSGLLRDLNLPNLVKLTNDRIAIMARNAPGAEHALKAEDPNFDPHSDAFKGIQTAYISYRTQDGSTTEPISQTGGGYINNDGNIYYLSKGVTADPSQVEKDSTILHYLHRETSAGYDAAAADGGNFTGWELSQRKQMGVETIAALGSAFSRLGQGDFVNTTEAQLRLGTGLLWGLVTSPIATVKNTLQGKFELESAVGVASYLLLGNPIIRTLLVKLGVALVGGANGARYLGGDPDSTAPIGEDSLRLAVGTYQVSTRKKMGE